MPGPGLCPHKLFWGEEGGVGRDLTEAGKLQKFDIRSLFLPKIAFSVSIQSMKQNLFYNSEVCSDVLHLIYLNPNQDGVFWYHICYCAPLLFSFICCPSTTKLGLRILWHKISQGQQKSNSKWRHCDAYDVIFVLSSIKNC